jgi:transposase-like protein
MSKPPPENVKRWTPQRKAEVLAAVRSDAITVDEACRRYEITGEEFLAWLRAFETHGLPGLRATRIQQYRPRRSSRRRKRRS